MSMTRVGGVAHTVMGPALLGSFRGSGEMKSGEGGGGKKKKNHLLVLAEQLLGVDFFFNIHERLSGSK